MNRTFADTPYFLALLGPDDEAHGRAVDITQHRSGQLVTTAWVLVELANFLAD